MSFPCSRAEAAVQARAPARVANFSGVILLEGLKNELVRPNWTPVLENSFQL